MLNTFLTKQFWNVLQHCDTGMGKQPLSARNSQHWVFIAMSSMSLNTTKTPTVEHRKLIFFHILCYWSRMTGVRDVFLHRKDRAVYTNDKENQTYTDFFLYIMLSRSRYYKVKVKLFFELEMIPCKETVQRSYKMWTKLAGVKKANYNQHWNDSATDEENISMATVKQNGNSL